MIIYKFNLIIFKKLELNTAGRFFVRSLKKDLNYIDFFLSKPLNLKKNLFFLTWFKIPIQLIPINSKWLIGYNKLA